MGPYISMSCDLLFSHLGYSSDRQLSLDLVNVGRQRLDFLPMLEHSGTYRESAVHSGTFAQEIITLVHQVKGQEPMDWPGSIFCILLGTELILANSLLVCFAESYFRGQGITLNQRFANEQYYSLQDEFKEEEEEEDEEELGNVRPVMNRYTCQLFSFLLISEACKSKHHWFFIIIIYIKG